MHTFQMQARLVNETTSDGFYIWLVGFTALLMLVSVYKSIKRKNVYTLILFILLHISAVLAAINFFFYKEASNIYLVIAMGATLLASIVLLVGTYFGLSESKVERFYRKNYNKNERAKWPAWKQSKTISDLNELTIDWLEGKASVIPALATQPSSQDALISADLVKLNRFGVLTQCFQPNGNLLRACVTGVTSPHLSEVMAENAKAEGLEALFYPFGTRIHDYPTHALRAPWREEVLQKAYTSPELEEVFKTAVAFTIWDPQNRERHLWDSLIGSLERNQKDTNKPSASAL